MILNVARIPFHLTALALLQYTTLPVSDASARYAFYGVLVASFAGLFTQVLSLINNWHIRKTTDATHRLVDGLTLEPQRVAVADKRRLAESGNQGDIDNLASAERILDAKVAGKAVEDSLK